MSTADTLALGGILHAGDVVRIAAQEGLDVDLAAAMLQAETGGGRMIWGHDDVPTGGFYTPGAVVTREAYLAWKPHRAQLGSNGVGATQLTSPGLQDAADALGGAWLPIPNLIIGFRFLAGLIRQYGVPAGVGHYNGSGPDDSYSRNVRALAALWRLRLGTTSTTGAPSPAARPQSVGDDVPWTHDEGAPSIPDFYPGAKSPLPDPAIALAWAAANAANARDRGEDAVRGIAVLAESMRAMNDTLNGLARLISVTGTSAPTDVPAQASAEIHYPTLVGEMLAQLGLTPHQVAPEGTP